MQGKVTITQKWLLKRRYPTTSGGYWLALEACFSEQSQSVTQAAEVGVCTAMIKWCVHGLLEAILLHDTLGIIQTHAWFKIVQLETMLSRWWTLLLSLVTYLIWSFSNNHFTIASFRISIQPCTVVTGPSYFIQPSVDWELLTKHHEVAFYWSPGHVSFFSTDHFVESVRFLSWCVQVIELLGFILTLLQKTVCSGCVPFSFIFPASDSHVAIDQQDIHQDFRESE
jgi:hypothetical protein